MLNQFKIGAKLTIGFSLVLVLLVIVAVVGYIALASNRQATKDTMQVEENRANVLSIRIHVNRALLRAAKGSLFRDLDFQTQRKGIDGELADVAKTLGEAISTANRPNLENLLTEYETFKADNDKWFQDEEKRVAAEQKLITVARNATAALEECVKLFCEEAEATKTGEGNDERLNATLVRQALRLEGYISDLGALRRGYYQMKAEPKADEQQKLGRNLETNAEKLEQAAAVHDFYANSQQRKREYAKSRQRKLSKEAKTADM